MRPDDKVREGIKKELHDSILAQLLEIQTAIKGDPGNTKPYLRDKDKVLQALETYISQGSADAFEHLKTTVNLNKNYDEGTKIPGIKKRSTTGQLLDRVLEFKNVSLEVKPPIKKQAVTPKVTMTPAMWQKKSDDEKATKNKLHAEIMSQLHEIQTAMKEDSGNTKPYLRDKDKVLQALETYLTKNSNETLEHLSRVVATNSNYDEGMKIPGIKKRSTTGQLLDKVLEFREVSLTSKNPYKP